MFRSTTFVMISELVQHRNKEVESDTDNFGSPAIGYIAPLADVGDCRDIFARAIRVLRTRLYRPQCSYGLDFLLYQERSKKVLLARSK
jgi:hypothetical protein